MLCLLRPIVLFLLWPVWLDSAAFVCFFALLVVFRLDLQLLQFVVSCAGWEVMAVDPVEYGGRRCSEGYESKASGC